MCTLPFFTFRYISFESCAGNLKDLVSGNYKGPSIGTNSEILAQITTGLDFLHSKKFFHRDLKPSNILISHPFRGISPRVKLSNFAFSPISNPLNPLPFWKQAGTNKAWMAPEIHQLNIVALPMNVFSLGLIFAFFLSGGLHPFSLDKEERVANIKKRQPIILTANQLLNVTGVAGAEVFNLICLMLNFDPEQRPAVSQILNHPFLKQQRTVLGNFQIPTELFIPNAVEIPSAIDCNSSLRPASADQQVAEGAKNNVDVTTQLQDSNLDASHRGRSNANPSSFASEPPASSSGLQQNKEHSNRYINAHLLIYNEY